MVDIFSKKKRSEIMSKIRGKNTKLEMLVFHELRKRGIYFQKYYRTEFGTPDLTLPRKKIAVFVDGDFWHGYQFSKNKSKLPKKYWQKKIQDNIDRDRKTRKRMRGVGWKVLRVWEHQLIEDFDNTIESIVNFIA